VRAARAGGCGCSNELAVMPIGPSTVCCMKRGNGVCVTSIISCCITVNPPPE
jgi:hypothetical protein